MHNIHVDVKHILRKKAYPLYLHWCYLDLGGGKKFQLFQQVPAVSTEDNIKQSPMHSYFTWCVFPQTRATDWAFDQ